MGNGCRSVDKLGATFGRVSKYLRGQRINAAAATVSRFKDGHLLARASKLSSGHQAGSPSANDQDMGQGGVSLVVNRRMRTLGSVTPSQPIRNRFRLISNSEHASVGQGALAKSREII